MKPLGFHPHRPHVAMHMPHPFHWLHEHQMAAVSLIISLLVLLIAGLLFFARGSGQPVEWFHMPRTQPWPYYPYY